MPGQERAVCPVDSGSHERAAMGPALVLEPKMGWTVRGKARVKAKLKLQMGVLPQSYL